MSKVVVFSITRDRLEYTKTCFGSFLDNGGYPNFDWYLIDNGSTDGTVEWIFDWDLDDYLNWYYRFDTNQGLSKAYNYGIKKIFEPPQNNYDYVVHFDNDCFVITPKTLSSIIAIYEKYPQFRDWVLSPQVAGLQNQPMRHKMYTPDNEIPLLSETVIGEVHNIGHLFMVVPTHIYRKFILNGGYPESMAKARGQDVYFCEWLRSNGYHVGYVENLVVQHYRTVHQQALDYPEYWKRKREEQS